MNIAGPQIQTVDGRYFHLDDFSQNVVSVETIAAALSKLCRYTGHCSEFYSVAQHSVMVSRIVPKEDALWGLFHDAAEAYIGDIARPLKRMLKDYLVLEEYIEFGVHSALGLTGMMPKSVQHADLVALATEKRDLLPPGPDWELLKGIEPLPEKIYPLWWKAAESLFLQRAKELGALK
jgi:hypothetical protein